MAYDCPKDSLDENEAGKRLFSTSRGRDLYQLVEPDRRDVLIFYSCPTINLDEAGDVKSSSLLLNYVFAFVWWRGRDNGKSFSAQASAVQRSAYRYRHGVNPLVSVYGYVDD